VKHSFWFLHCFNFISLRFYIHVELNLGIRILRRILDISAISRKLLINHKDSEIPSAQKKSFHSYLNRDTGRRLTVKADALLRKIRRKSDN